jgi:hypothetical protein
MSKMPRASNLAVSPISSWLKWMSENGLESSSLYVGLATVIIIKTAVGMGGFSGSYPSTA